MKKIISFILCLCALFSLSIGGTNLAMTVSAGTADLYVHPTETTIEVEGLKNEYKFLQISDIHVTELPSLLDANYNYALGRRALYTTLGGGTTTAQRLSYFFRYAADHGIDLVILTGDIIDSALNENVAMLESILGEATVPYIYAVGNHDYTFPDHYFDNYSTTTLRPKLSTVASGNTFYNYVEYDDLIVAVIDDSQEMITNSSTASFVRSTLKASSKPVLLGYHIPFHAETLTQPLIDMWEYDRTLGPHRDASMYDLKTRVVYEYANSENSNLIGTLCGHIHSEREDLLAGGVMQYCAPPAYDGGCRLITVTPQVGEPCQHTYTSVVTREATITTRGEMKYTCTECGKTYLAVIPLSDFDKGDANGDGSVNTSDPMRLKLYFLGKFVLDARQMTAADVNSDGRVNMLDMLLLKKYLAGKITSF